MIIDSHCHLNDLDNLPGIMERAEKNNVTAILNIGTSFDDFAPNEKIADAFVNIYLACGIHPEYADNNVDFDAAKLKKHLRHPKTIALGEIGLDYYYNADSREKQITLFRRQLDIAAAESLPVIIHSREADDDCQKILSEYKNQISGVLHCFSSSKALCEFGLAIGFYISASGIITFKNAQNLRDIFATVPVNRLLVETDAPYLAPHPLRGKTNEPSFIVHTLECLAKIKNMSAENMAKNTSENFFNLFTKAKTCE